MRVVTWNLHFALGTDYRLGPRRILDALDGFGAEIACLQEAETRIGRRSSLPLDAVTERGWTPVGQAKPGALGYRGNAILLRGGLSASDLHHLPLHGWETRGALLARIESGQGAFSLACVHLGLLRMHRVPQLRAVLDALRAMPGPHAVIGDTNEWRRAPLPLPEGWVDHAPGPSFSSRWKVFRLDRLLTGPGLALSAARVEDAGFDKRASDHLPVTACLTLGPS
jgi:endonuclease/exonuclease/phosphatase family metal-dependent hydrolase